jgi:NADPH:quinone reductase-like Zn-dependent oxidoreductase
LADKLTGLELRSLITDQGQLRITLDDVARGEPKAGEVVVRVEAAPINPSDLGLLLGPADLGTMKTEGAPGSLALTASVPVEALPGIRGRFGQALPVGNEGAGVVIRAGSDVQHLLGRKVGMIGGGMYATLRRVPVRDCIVLPDDVSAAEGASLFVNPLTALGFVETMRSEGHHAIVHTAAASNLGQMLVRICLADGIPLVNVVRSPQQAALLAEIGASHVVDSSAPGFQSLLVEAVGAAGATLGFDAIGGGEMAGHILNAMETVAAGKLQSYSRYGSTTPKQVYIYGSLDRGPTVLKRSFGFTWSVGGWLLFNFLQRAGEQQIRRMRQRVVDEIRTTFASGYAATISLGDVLNPATIASIAHLGTGAKVLINPNM